jgi:riboflavin biosynthesis pyrimidine reductase
LSTPRECRRLEPATSRQPWIELVPVQDENLRTPLEYLRRERGIQRVSAVGGRTVASALIDAGLIRDLCLTTTTRTAGEPDTPLYVGKRPPAMRLVVRKEGTDPDYPIVFEHLAIARPA